MNILLISANNVTTPYPVYPIGLDYVIHSIPAHHRVKVIDMNSVADPGDLSGMISAESPDIVGISLRNIDNTDATDPVGFITYYRQLINSIRQGTGAPVVLGGSGFTIFAERLMAELDADYGISGEGERFSLFLDALETQKDPCGIPGVLGRRTGESYRLPDAWEDKIERVLPEQPDPCLSYYINNGGILNLQTKRGCPYQCIYCTYPHIEGRTMRFLEPDEVGKTAAALEKSGARYLFITDSTFNTDIEHSLAVAKAIKRAGVTLPWGAFFAPVHLPDGYFQTMAECGLTHVEFGTDALSDKVLEIYRKPFRVSDVIRAHDEAVKAGLHAAHFFVLGGPGETPATLGETFSNIDKLKKTVLFFFCGMRIYPYTKLYDMAVEKKQLAASATLLDPVFYQPEDLNQEEIIRRVKEIGRTRSNWVCGAGGDDTVSITSRMYQKGYTGPLWEYLIR